MVMQDLFSPSKVIKDWKDLEWWTSADRDVMNIFLDGLDQTNKPYCPSRKNIYRAFELTPFNDVKVVIIGQDPYPRISHAHGLAFSIPEDADMPMSLKNIYKEMFEDIGCYPRNGNLEFWARQGVLLLNTVLTCAIGFSMSHGDIGWQKLTYEAIRSLAVQRAGLIFLCWGAHAINSITEAGVTTKMLKDNYHELLVSAHPSPRSADRGFFGSRPFSKINKLLEARGVEKIDWCGKVGR